MKPRGILIEKTQWFLRGWREWHVNLQSEWRPRAFYMRKHNDFSAVGGGLRRGYVSGSCTHGGCYATAWVGWGVATLVFMRTHGTVGVSCAKVLRLGCFGVGSVNLRFFCKHGMLLLRFWKLWSGGKDIPPIRNTMHQVKLHQTALMANRVKWIRCKLQVILDFYSARFGEKIRFGHCQNIQWSIASENMIRSLLPKKHISYGKTS